MVAGTAAWALWVLFVHERESAALGLAKLFFGVPSLATGSLVARVDPIVVALPLAALVTWAGSLLGRPAEVAGAARPGVHPAP
jgi:SSS family solute:Na+ symporter